MVLCVVARVLLCGTYGGCSGVAMQVVGLIATVLLWYSGWLLGCCYVVSRVFLMIARVLLCGTLCGCCAVAMVLWVVARVLLCGL